VDRECRIVEAHFWFIGDRFQSTRAMTPEEIPTPTNSGEHQSKARADNDEGQYNQASEGSRCV
jgi:hypothetical protein